MMYEQITLQIQITTCPHACEGKYKIIPRGLVGPRMMPHGNGARLRLALELYENDERANEKSTASHTCKDRQMEHRCKSPIVYENDERANKKYGRGT